MGSGERSEAASGLAGTTLEEIGSHLEHVKEGKHGAGDSPCCSIATHLEKEHIKKNDSKEFEKIEKTCKPVPQPGVEPQGPVLGLSDCFKHDNCVQVMYKNTFLHVQLSHEGSARQRSKSCDHCTETARCPTHAEIMEPLPRHRVHHERCPNRPPGKALVNQPLRTPVTGRTTLEDIASHLANVQEGLAETETCKFRGPAEVPSARGPGSRGSERSARFEVGATQAERSVKLRHAGSPGTYLHVQLETEAPAPSRGDGGAEGQSCQPCTPPLWPVYRRDPEPAGPGVRLDSSFKLPASTAEMIDQVQADLNKSVGAPDRTPAPAPRRPASSTSEKKHRKKRPAGEEKKQLRPGEKSVLLSGVPDWYTTQHLVTLFADCGILATQEVDFIYLPRRPPPGANGRSAVVNLRSPEGEVAFTSVFQGCCLPGSTLHSVITKAKVQGWVNNVAYFASASRDSKANRPYVLQATA